MFNVVLHPLAEKDLDQLDNPTRMQVLQIILTPTERYFRIATSSNLTPNFLGT